MVLHHPFSNPRCLQNYIPAHSLTLSCPVCRQTSILPEKGVAALQNNFFITNLMDVLQRAPDSCSQEATALNNMATVATGRLLSCPNHGGSVRYTSGLSNLFLFYSTGSSDLLKSVFTPVIMSLYREPESEVRKSKHFLD